MNFGIDLMYCFDKFYIQSRKVNWTESVKKPVINKQITQSNVPQTYLAKEPVWT
jgi:hypothetical protein